MVNIFGDELASSVDELRADLYTIGGGIDSLEYKLHCLLFDLATDIQDIHRVLPEDDEHHLKANTKNIYDTLMKYCDPEYNPSYDFTPAKGEQEEPADQERPEDGEKQEPKDEGIFVIDPDTGRTVQKFKDDSYVVFKENGCADFYDSEGRPTGFTC